MQTTLKGNVQIAFIVTVAKDFKMRLFQLVSHEVLAFFISEENQQKLFSINVLAKIFLWQAYNCSYSPLNGFVMPEYIIYIYIATSNIILLFPIILRLIYS